MDEYLIGVVRQYQSERIIFESNNRGFIFQGVHLELLPLNQEIKLYIYFYQRLPISEYFAFLNQETKQYFLELISISYVGPKLSLRILNFFSMAEFKILLQNCDVSMLAKVKGITNKLASAIFKHFKNSC
ncbi:helix-hairpin-helix domain-containing protein [Spiroplasma platyhelix]|uniref:Holliday junction DNA helicase RuvA n=1 Tax=Spiroplasma platyhelix PALS-1 TaxID=1276218 RepID=A0A846TSB3_9MOLU|nr:helix-hairpin-helix domain-containing protein [Spiroplasma platyhelix]MBE4704024.1 Holliday junction ATP-dependent DNA helicase RuvA [Spiroplasma platyhelix PALS-1]NKE38395.1 hypothetical protein [Spiroplasma platyhelix PALS-1]UJB29282.1 holliday junction DNA helicase RuvA [Spiroplasma platyhelix PALS-1]